MDIKAVRKTIFDRWRQILSFGGEWNAGYAEGINFALGEIDRFIRENEVKSDHNITDPKEALVMNVAKEYLSGFQDKCGGKNCPCKR